MSAHRPRYLDTTEGRMMQVLLGGVGAMKHLHARQTCHALGRELELQRGDAVAISCEAQDAASQFIWKHGTRVARRYVQALRRSRTAASMVHAAGANAAMARTGADDDDEG